MNRIAGPRSISIGQAAAMGGRSSQVRWRRGCVTVVVAVGSTSVMG
ncbi:hypothetical protein HCH_00969 [Hahella chejuensis KCTC 2396]|uniref:Uncharacterized protein n=1 Tax=Hahella chejuensis (strain KCTC 2396) TaxID=349521 RepID=Q2SNB8_HAHCH|nr:hypothetical protein HCH_00969 [Hahella chejuensis KCTC 2396]